MESVYEEGPEERGMRSNRDEELDSSPLESFAGKKEGKDVHGGKEITSLVIT